MRFKHFMNDIAESRGSLAAVLVTVLFAASCNDSQNEPGALDVSAASAKPRCALALGNLLKGCPTSGTCTMSSPDGLGRVAHCYGDGSKDVMHLSPEGAAIRVFDRQQTLCYRVTSGRPNGEFDILSKKGDLVATVKKAANGEFIARCDGLAFNLDDYRQSQSRNILETCVQGACAFPPEAKAAR